MAEQGLAGRSDCTWTATRPLGVQRLEKLQRLDDLLVGCVAFIKALVPSATMRRKALC
ncbi:MAG: hypothetical protein HY684_00055 [Chloroflexi bacterium]|nr:hypothetical protein [Chloroflexota bacterium]